MVLRRLGEWCARHFVIVIVAWIVALGAHAWWTPRWLDRTLPRIDTEGAGEELGAGRATARRAPRP
ncbi:hypothetical protein IM697_09650 [Streptomyces ferrugineus]|uniref:Uncharacterized protein n=1 Tax=Streptomyces ferrugineus TaxID=1413221 RepID=A0A7M2SQS6_9ACTN|nr:hypothetical protein IM697_09650 [Streptomyces ferrugineus]